MPAQSQSTFTVTVKTNAASCQPGAATLTVTGGTGSLNATWSNGNAGLSASALEAGTYTVAISDSLGNDTVVSVTIEGKICSISAETSFTPNGDGINDQWNVYGSQHYDNYLIQIFNRWGQKVFESKSQFEPWDGKAFGSPVPDGTYYYVIEFTDKYEGDQKKNGSITILR